MKVSIWQGTLRGEDRWIVAYQVAGKMVRKFFRDQQDAEALRDELAGAIRTPRPNAGLSSRSRPGSGSSWPGKTAEKLGLDLFDCVRRAMGGPQTPVVHTPAAAIRRPSLGRMVYRRSLPE